MMKNQQRIEQIAGLALIGAIVVGCGFVLRPFALPILWAAILCFATWPLHELLLKWLHGRRNLAAGLMTIMLLLVLFIPFFMVGLTFTESIGSAVQWFESHREAGLPPPPEWVERIPLVGVRISEHWSMLAESAEPALNRLRPWLKEAGVWLLRHSLDFAHGVFQLAMSVLIAFFLYRDGEGVVAGVRNGFQRISGDYAQHLIDVVKINRAECRLWYYRHGTGPGRAGWCRIRYRGGALAGAACAIYFFPQLHSLWPADYLDKRIGLAFFA